MRTKFLAVLGFLAFSFFFSGKVRADVYTPVDKIYTDATYTYVEVESGNYSQALLNNTAEIRLANPANDTIFYACGTSATSQKYYYGYGQTNDTTRQKMNQGIKQTVAMTTNCTSQGVFSHDATNFKGLIFTNLSTVPLILRFTTTDIVLTGGPWPLGILGNGNTKYLKLADGTWASGLFPSTLKLSKRNTAVSGQYMLLAQNTSSYYADFVCANSSGANCMTDGATTFQEVISTYPPNIGYSVPTGGTSIYCKGTASHCALVYDIETLSDNGSSASGGSALTDLATAIGGAIATPIQTAFNYLFTPPAGYLDSKMTTYYAVRDAKFPAWTQVTTLTSSLETSMASGSETAPSLPTLSMYGANNMQIMNTAPLDAYMPTLKNYERIFLWFFCAVYSVRAVHAFFKPESAINTQNI